MPSYGEDLGGLVAGAVAGDDGDGIISVILPETKGKFAVGGNYGQAAVNLDSSVGFGLAGDFNNFLKIALGGVVVGGRSDG